MQYKVTSKIVKLRQTVRSTTVIHDHNLPRTVEWLKVTDYGEFFTHEEAIKLEKYLESKKIFSGNQIVEITDDDLEPSVTDMMIFSKDLAEGNIAMSYPIKSSQYSDLNDYNLNFPIEGHLNTIDLTK
jgi:hypothetical protein